MGFQKYFKNPSLEANPLCGITVSGSATIPSGTYKDVLNLATGEITRKITKIVLTGQEVWLKDTTNNAYFYASRYLDDSRIIDYDITQAKGFCTHYICFIVASGNSGDGAFVTAGGSVRIRDKRFTEVADFTAYVAAEYANGTPITLWPIRANEITETIEVPTGLTGTVDGWMSQSDTPTPTSPIYPTANTAVGWYNLQSYVRDTTWQSGTVYKRINDYWGVNRAKRRSNKIKVSKPPIPEDFDQEGMDKNIYE